MDFLFGGNKNSKKIANIVRIKILPNSQFLRGGSRRKKVKFKLRIKKKKRKLRNDALLSFSKKLKIEKRRKNNARALNKISPRMPQIFMG